MEPTIVRLTSPMTDVIVRCQPFAEILYWGPHLSGFMPEDVLTLSRAVPNGRLDVDAPLTLAAESGRGLFGSPGVEGHRDGWAATTQRTAIGQRQRRAKDAPYVDQSSCCSLLG